MEQVATKATKVDEQVAIEQINNKAQETQARINARLPEIEIAIRSAEEELSIFPQQRTARGERLTSEHNALTASQTALGKAESYAHVALGTLGEKNAIKAVSSAKKSLEAAQKRFDTMESMLKKEQDEADAREQELTAQIATLRAEYLTIQSEWRSVEVAREQSHREMGAMKATAINDRVDAREAQIDKLKEQLVALQTEQYDDVEQAVRDLQPWSDHRFALRKKHPAHDVTTEVLQHEIAYISSLLRNSQTLPYNEQLYNLLAVPAGELHFQEHLRQNPKSLRARLSEIETLLAAHQQSLQR